MKKKEQDLSQLIQQIVDIKQNNEDFNVLLNKCGHFIMEQFGSNSVYDELFSSIKFLKNDPSSNYYTLAQLLFTREKEKLFDLLSVIKLNIHQNEYRQTISEISCLRSYLKLKVNFENSGMVSIDVVNNGRGFFPYSSGLQPGNKIFPKYGIMILGQDFGTEDYVMQLNGKDESTSIPTWRNLLGLLKMANINESECFFTNAIMGARKSGERMTGQAPPFNDKKYLEGDRFLKECSQFLNIQIEIQKPRLIICMGKWVMQFLKMYLKFEYLNDFNANKAYWTIPNYMFYQKSVDMGSRKADIALIVHPSTPNRTNNRKVELEAEMLKSNLQAQ